MFSEFISLIGCPVDRQTVPWIDEYGMYLDQRSEVREDHPQVMHNIGLGSNFRLVFRGRSRGGISRSD